MIRTLRMFLDMLEARERRGLWLLLAALIAMGFANMLGVASILPLLTVLAEPERIHSDWRLAALYDRFGFESPIAFTIALGAAVAVFFQITVAVRAATTYAVARFGQMRAYSISHRILRGYLAQPYAWFLDRNTADMIKTLMQESVQLVNGSIVPLLNMIASALVALFLVGLLVAADWRAALLTAAVLGIAFLGVFMTVRTRLRRSGQARVAANRARFRAAQEALAGVREIKMLGIEGAAAARYGAAASRFARAMASSQVLSQVPQEILEGIAFLLVVAVLLAIYASHDGDVRTLIPVVGLYAVAGVRLLPSVKSIFQSAAKIRFGLPTVEHIHREYMELGRQAPPPAAVVPLVLRDRIELRSVRYTYPSAASPALRELTLDIPAGACVGFVGGTGAGKTTALDVLLGLLQPEAGGLYVDGVKVEGAATRAWQAGVGYVPQQIFLIDGSIAANIALGDAAGTIDMAAVERAARLAQLHDFVVTQTTAGYESPVGERGIKLSGGQRQRIGIARALYRDPPVLVLDEATAALDTVTERALMKAVGELAGAKTIIMVAHRLSTVKNCAEIFLFERGALIARGPYSSLVEQNEAFREMAIGAA